MTQATTHRASELARSSTHADEGVIWTVYTDIGSRKCTACGLLCELAIQTNDGEPTGVTRFSNVRPLQNILTVQLDLDIRRQ